MDYDPLLDAAAALTPKAAVAAILVDVRGAYLLQHRDANPEIFFPDHWTFFGGAVEDDELPLAALVRELSEEIELVLDRSRLKPFTTFSFDMGFAGGPIIPRFFYEARLSDREIGALVQHEGQAMRWMTGRDALASLRLAPYDAFALWLHKDRDRLVFPPSSPSNDPR